MPWNKPAQRILIADDDPLSGTILSAYLMSDRYDIRFVDAPERVLKEAAELHPDLILLDIMMPGMSGFEICERLKSDEITREIPVLFTTALSDRRSHRRAIEAGGEGFITKPYDEKLVQAYVKTFLRMSRSHSETKDKISCGNDLVAMALHDLNNLNMAVSANLELALLARDPARSAFYVKTAHRVLQSTAEMIQRLQSVIRLESLAETIRTERIDLVDLLKEASVTFDAEMQAKRMELNLECPEFAPVKGDKSLLRRVVMNLMDNAVKFAPAGTAISIRLRETGGLLKERLQAKGGGLESFEIMVGNEGDPIPVGEQQSIFEKYKRASNVRGTGRGLGLAFCKQAIEPHGGRIWIESPLPGLKTGVAVHLTLPRAI